MLADDCDFSLSSLTYSSDGVETTVCSSEELFHSEGALGVEVPELDKLAP